MLINIASRPFIALFPLLAVGQCDIRGRGKCEPSHVQRAEWLIRKQILFHSSERQYIITNLPWLIGSLGTMAEDVTIFVQFRLYSNTGATSAIV